MAMRTIVIIGLLVLFGCSKGSTGRRTSPTKEAPTSEVAPGDLTKNNNSQKRTNNGKNHRLPFVILPPSESATLADEEEWALTEEIVLKEEARIFQCIEVHSPNLYKIINEYRVQYFGVVSNKKKVIYCHFFRDISNRHEDWKESMALVIGRGANYFGFRYDLESKKTLDRIATIGNDHKRFVVPVDEHGNDILPAFDGGCELPKEH